MFPCHECHFSTTGTTLVKYSSLVVIDTVESKRVASKDTIEINIGEAVEKTLIDFLVYRDT